MAVSSRSTEIGLGAVVAERGKANKARGVPEEAKIAAKLAEQRRTKPAGSIFESLRAQVTTGKERPKNVQDASDRMTEVTQAVNGEFSQELKGVDGKNLRETDANIKSRSENVAKLAEIQRQILEQGFGSLNPEQRQLVRNSMDQILRQSPEIQAATSHLTDAERTAFLDNLASSDLYASKLAEIVMKGYKNIEALDPDLLKKLNEVQEKIANFDKKTQQREQAKVTKNVLKDCKTLVEDPDPAKAKDAHDKALEQIDASKTGSVANQIQTLENTNPRSAAQEQQLVQLRAEDFKNTQIVNALKELYSTPPKTPAEVANDIDGSTTGLDANISLLDQELNGIDRDKLVQEHEEALRARENAENEIASQIEGGIQLATLDMLDQEVKYYEGKVKAYDEAQLGKSTSDQVLDNMMQNRWFKRGKGILGREKSRALRGKMVEDYNRLLKGDIRGIMTELSDDPNLTMEERIALVNNKEMQAQVARNIIMNKMKNGGISATEARSLLMTSWGKDAVEQALTMNRDLNKFIGDLEDQGVLKGGFAEWLAKQGGKNIVTILMGLLLGVGGIALAATVGTPIAIGAGGIALASGAVTSKLGTEKAA